MDFNYQFNALVESVVDYASKHSNRQQGHTMTDINKQYLRKSQNLVPEYTKSKNGIKGILDNVQKSGIVKVLQQNELSQLMQTYKFDLSKIQQGQPKHLGNMDLILCYDPQMQAYKIMKG